MTVVEEMAEATSGMAPRAQKKSMDHHELIEDMKITSKLSVEERVRLAKVNRQTQLEGYDEFDSKSQSPGDEHSVRISFPHDVYLMDAATKGAVEDMKELLKGGERKG